MLREAISCPSGSPVHSSNALGHRGNKPVLPDSIDERRISACIFSELKHAIGADCYENLAAAVFEFPQNGTPSKSRLRGQFEKALIHSKCTRFALDATEIAL